MNSAYMETEQTHLSCIDMADDSQDLLNIVVQNVIPGSIQEFMRAWMKQDSKDYRIVFI